MKTIARSGAVAARSSRQPSPFPQASGPTLSMHTSPVGSARSDRARCTGDDEADDSPAVVYGDEPDAPVLGRGGQLLRSSALYLRHRQVLQVLVGLHAAVGHLPDADVQRPQRIGVFGNRRPTLPPIS
ncbi:MAG: hypothetical protein M3425_11590 [Actinomycetota bacterium]|nr:hypothetical protein [Actinomycetota bacterium]